MTAKRSKPAADGSAEAAHDFQFRLLEQMTTIGTAGAALTITLVGGVLRSDGLLTWVTVALFGGAALLSILAQSTMTRELYRNDPRPDRYRILSFAIIFSIALGTGALGVCVFDSMAREPVPSGTPVAGCP